MASQNISKSESKTFINAEGDTLTIMHYEDARQLLGDLLDYQIVDSLLSEYMIKDSINTNTILLSNNAITELKAKCDNKETKITNLNDILVNKESEITMLNSIIKQQKKEIIKQKALKVIGFIAAIVLPITVLILIH